MNDKENAEDDLQEFKIKYRDKMFAVAEGEAIARGYKEKISEIAIITSKSKITINSNRKHFIFSETINYFGLSEDIKIVVYLTP